ncbi:MAG: hypothetical protein HY913_02110 [Desulfomonile tiedjei]|nr:hypothetical protein [Desulfomonile tiedjei]
MAGFNKLRRLRFVPLIAATLVVCAWFIFSGLFAGDALAQLRPEALEDRRIQSLDTNKPRATPTPTPAGVEKHIYIVPEITPSPTPASKRLAPPTQPPIDQKAVTDLTKEINALRQELKNLRIQLQNPATNGTPKPEPKKNRPRQESSLKDCP